MDPKKWVGKSTKTDFIPGQEIIQQVEEKLGRGRYVVEKGDELNLYGHWFFSHDDSLIVDELTDSENEDYKFYWHSGRIEYNKYLVLGSIFSRTVQVRDVQEYDDEHSSYLITLEIRIRSGNKVILEEEQVLILCKSIESYQDLRRINFEPDWSQKVKLEEINGLANLHGSIVGYPVTDPLNHVNDHQNTIQVHGSKSLILLLESFMYHFESRKTDRFSYKIHTFSNEGQLSIAGKDTDAFVTSLRLVNSRRQVLASVDIRWSYNW